MTLSVKWKQCIKLLAENGAGKRQLSIWKVFGPISNLLARNYRHGGDIVQTRYKLNSHQFLLVSTLILE